MNKQNINKLINQFAAVANDKKYNYPIKPPVLTAGVVPEGKTAPVLAMDNAAYQLPYSIVPNGTYSGFPGYAYLSQLATRAEYRLMASAMSVEMTREWIEFTGSNGGDDLQDKINAIEDVIDRIHLRDVIRRAVEMDCYFGRAQIFVDVGGDPELPVVLDARSIGTNSLRGIRLVEPIWTTPSTYNANNPLAPDFYKPSDWFVLGQMIHATRLLTVTTRELPDIIKPAFNFSGMSLSQLAEPYVDNWLRTRQSVADLINNFSITALATSMDQVLQGADDGSDLFSRAQLFTAMRSNNGLMMLDKDREELVQINTPLSGLSDLQAQSQEHMCSVSRLPAIILTGISPSGLNATSDGEIRIFYDWIKAQQEAHWREPLTFIIGAIQLSLFGEIDPAISFDFVPLNQLTPREQSDIRLQDSQANVAYIQAGVLDPTEVREQIADDPSSLYPGLDLTAEIVTPQPVEGEAPPDGMNENG